MSSESRARSGSPSRIIVLDRDGVLNRVVVHSEMGTIDSPMNVSEVDVFPWVPTALFELQQMGFALAIATNQPSAAKGKTSRENLEMVHRRIVETAEANGARISSSQICFHRSEDGCLCRKPKPKMLEDALRECGISDSRGSWMVGDGVTDVQAGVAAHMKTAFLGPQKCDGYKAMQERKLEPDFWGADLRAFVAFLKASAT